MKSVEVSIVIPFYKNKDWLNEAIESIVHQTYQNYEIILVNDGSPEDISDIISKYQHHIRYFYQKNKGAASARNLGIENSKGTYISFLDADDLWLPTKLEKQIKKMESEGNVWSHCSYEIFDNKSLNKEINCSKYKDNIFPVSIISSPIATPCIMIKKNILQENRYLRFNEDMRAGEDTYLWLLLSKKYNISVVNESLVKVRIRGTNAALLSFSQLEARSKIWNIIKNDFSITSCLSLKVKYAFKYCNSIFLSLSTIESKKILSKNCIENLAKIIYILPWIIFKYEKNRLLK